MHAPSFVFHGKFRIDLMVGLYRALQRFGLFLVAVGLVSCSSTLKDVTPDAPAVPKEYRLSTGDIVQVDVFQEPILTSRQRILANGTIFVGLLGRVKIGGETVEQAGNKIARLLNEKQLVNPQVTLTVLAYNPRRFMIWGQVRSPGNFTLQPEEILYLPQAIALAGGNTAIGDLKRVVVSRRIGGEIKRIRINALSKEAEFFIIEEGDIILVKETIF